MSATDYTYMLNDTDKASFRADVTNLDDAVNRIVAEIVESARRGDYGCDGAVPAPGDYLDTIRILDADADEVESRDVYMPEAE